jgi:hypothetical protein
MRCFAAKAVALLVAVAAPIAAHAGMMPFQALVKDYYDAEFAARPTLATRVGVHDYDTKLDDLSSAGWAAAIARLHAALNRFQQSDPASMSAEDRDDREVLTSSIKGSLLDAETIHNWQKDPGLYSGAATTAIFGLVHRDFAPAADRLRSVIARERLLPALLDAGKQNIAHPPRVFVEIALRNVAGSLVFFQTGVPAAFAGVADQALQHDFNAANGAVIQALQSYRSWMEQTLLPHADGEFALGAKLFAERLNDNEMVDLPPDRLLEIAEAQLHKDQAGLKAAAGNLKPGASIAEVEQSIRSDHPTAATLIPTARD